MASGASGVYGRIVEVVWGEVEEIWKIASGLFSLLVLKYKALCGSSHLFNENRAQKFEAVPERSPFHLYVWVFGQSLE